MCSYHDCFLIIYTFIIFHLPYLFIILFDFGPGIVFIIYAIVESHSLMQYNMTKDMESHLDKEELFFSKVIRFMQFISLTIFVLVIGINKIIYGKYDYELCFITNGLSFFMTIFNYGMVVVFTFRRRSYN